MINTLNEKEINQIKFKCPLREDGCCGTIKAICELCDHSFNKEKVEELIKVKTGLDIVLQVRKQN